MAKKKTKSAVEETVVNEQVVEVKEQPITKTPIKPRGKVHKKLDDGWEVKDRVYVLTSGKTPLSSQIKAADIYYFDEKLGHERELKYTKNQTSCFVDEMKGDQRLEHIVFRNGTLAVPKNKTVLQRLLSIYHPHRNKVYREVNEVAKAQSQLDVMELEIEALMAAQGLDIDMAEAVLRVEVGSRVSEMSSKELKRDLLLYAKRNPELFLELVNDDNVQLRNFGIKATELNIIKLSSDQRHFMWGSNGRKLMTVPFDEHPYSALAQWFKTDEGMEVYTNIEKRLS